MYKHIEGNKKKISNVVDSYPNLNACVFFSEKKWFYIGKTQTTLWSHPKI
jgi:hypothetical protein